MFSTFHRISSSYKSISLFLFHSWPESQSASLPLSGVRPPWRLTNAEHELPQAELRGLTVLQPHGAWGTEDSDNYTRSGCPIIFPGLALRSAKSYSRNKRQIAAPIEATSVARAPLCVA